MSFHAEIDIENTPVLILGGGNVALRKAKQCLQQGANVFVLAKEVKDEFKELAITILQESYHSEMLLQYLFCIVCTSDNAFNEQVFKDAKNMHCLCMGVHRDDASNMRAMVSKDFGEFQVAVSTKGNYPAMSSSLVDQAGAFLYKTQRKRLLLLSSIRDILPHDMDASMRQEFCHLLLAVTFDLLLQIKEILVHDTIRILCYHGVKNEKAIENIKSFETLVQKKYPNDIICSAYIAREVCKTINAKVYQVLELALFLPYFHQFRKTIILQPMLFQKGAYFDFIQKWETYTNVTVKDPIFADDGAIKALCERISSSYAAFDKIFVCYHSSRDGDFCNTVKKMASQYPNIHFTSKVQLPLALNEKKHHIMILSLYMLSGKHSKDDVMAVKELRRKGYEVTYLEPCMIELDDTREVLIQRI